ncbi:MAG TPA: dTDP-4-dehydrorhamnose reductase [Rhizomicrobium sp.]|nr:dTDP-4-dehydrorhamnose reductase [Rhizomicrobium sp.]
MKILVAGRSGQLARALSRRMKYIALGRPELDVTDAASVAAAMAVHRPDVLINAAAYSAVDRAEDDRDAAFAVNADGPRNLARAAEAHDIPLVHISTDYVFGDGGDGRPWREDDPVSPKSVYGQSKLAGEEAVRAQAARHVILRTSWLFSGTGRNFVRTMLDLARTRPALGIVDDQWGCPTAAEDLARVVAAVASAAGPYGTYHYCGAGPVTWFGFAQAIFTLSGGPRPALTPISTAEFAARAPRPAYSVLDTAKIARDYGIEQRPWREGLEAAMRELEA